MRIYLSLIKFWNSTKMLYLFLLQDVSLSLGPKSYIYASPLDPEQENFTFLDDGSDNAHNMAQFHFFGPHQKLKHNEI